MSEETKLDGKETEDDPKKEAAETETNKTKVMTEAEKKEAEEKEAAKKEAELKEAELKKAEKKAENAKAAKEARIKKQARLKLAHPMLSTMKMTVLGSLIYQEEQDFTRFLHKESLEKIVGAYGISVQTSTNSTTTVCVIGDVTRDTSKTKHKPFKGAKQHELILSQKAVREVESLLLFPFQ
jgi:hypothetical protein